VFIVLNNDNYDFRHIHAGLTYICLLCLSFEISLDLICLLDLMDVNKKGKQKPNIRLLPPV